MKFFCRTLIYLSPPPPSTPHPQVVPLQVCVSGRAASVMRSYDVMQFMQEQPSDQSGGVSVCVCMCVRSKEREIETEKQKQKETLSVEFFHCQRFLLRCFVKLLMSWSLGKSFFKSSLVLLSNLLTIFPSVSVDGIILVLQVFLNPSVGKTKMLT